LLEQNRNYGDQCAFPKEDQLRLISVGCRRLLSALALSCRDCRLARSGGISPPERWQSPVWADGPSGRPHSLVGRTNPTGRSVAVRQANATGGPSLSRQTGAGTSPRSGPNEPKIPNKTTLRTRLRGSGKESRHAGLRYHGQTNRRGRPIAGWAEMSDWAERTQTRGRGMPAALYLLRLGLIRLLALRLKILLYFSCCLQGGLFLRSLRLCLFAVLNDQSVAKPVDWKRSRGSAPTLPPGCFGQTNPRSNPAARVSANEPKVQAK
jgi:hypothetical protein